MATRRLLICNEKGLHARAAARFVEAVERHDADARVSHAGMSVSGDSIMGLLMLGAAHGVAIEVTTSGAEAEALMAALEELVADRFGEGR
ncbi:HPr family phosphocarrier protein [Pikeienuella sp. HZG-20]|uniref:HPr family phosphocarrier protein n=1 Tax=Paludibacillus litoralis TaxID=3133267 RepID=UPI0030EF6D84